MKMASDGAEHTLALRAAVRRLVQARVEQDLPRRVEEPATLAAIAAHIAYRVAEPVSSVA